MKKWMLFAIVMIAVLIAAEDEIVIKDVNPDTVPEYSVIRFLVSKGIMTLENGKFGGSEVVSRYELARILYRLIKYLLGRSPEEISAGGVKPLDEVYSILGYNPEKKDFERIELIENRLKDLEVAYLNVAGNIGDLKDGLKAVRRDIEGLTKSLESLDSRVGGISKEVSRVESELAGIREKLETLESGYGDLRKEIEGMGRDLETLEASFSNYDVEFRNSMDHVLSKIRELEERIEGIREREGKARVSSEDVSEEMGNLKIEVSRLRNELDDLRARLSELEGERIYGRAAAEYPIPPEVPSPPPTTLIERAASELREELDSRLEEIEERLATELRMMVSEEVSRISSRVSPKVEVKPEDLEKIREEVEESVRKSLESREFAKKGELDLAILDLEKRLMRWILWTTVALGIMITLLLVI